ncbi:MAG: MBL fold metallo-hydrolase, partial [Myxococcales bacterium]|nr:MBL fold metallo-hydrolase [Myxococcales bacterium]
MAIGKWTADTVDVPVELTFWGVRGSIPVPGGDTARWGGNSSCVEVRHGDLPPLVLDCGTGARALGVKLAREHARRVHVLLSHLHADHIFGFPFFMPLYAPGTQVRVGLPAYS